MREFFVNEEIGIPFHKFDLTHICLLVLLAIILFIIYKKRNDLPNIKHKKRLKVIFSIILITNMCILYGSYIYYGVWDFRMHLPLHLCFITGNLYAIAAIFDLKELYKWVYFLVFVGPLSAIIWPDNTSCFDNYLWYHYIISHHGLFIFSFITYYMDKVKIEKRDLLNALLVGNIIFVSMAIFNDIFGTTYIMTTELPKHMLDLYPFLQNIKYPMLILELLGIVVFAIACIPVYFRNKELESNKK